MTAFLPPHERSCTFRNGQPYSAGRLSPWPLRLKNSHWRFLIKQQRQDAGQKGRLLQPDPSRASQPLRGNGWRVRWDISLSVRARRSSIAAVLIILSGSSPLQVHKLPTLLPPLPGVRVRICLKAPIQPNYYTSVWPLASAWLSTPGFSLESQVVSSILQYVELNSPSIHILIATGHTWTLHYWCCTMGKRRSRLHCSDVWSHGISWCRQRTLSGPSRCHD